MVFYLPHILTVQETRRCFRVVPTAARILAGRLISCVAVATVNYVVWIAHRTALDRAWEHRSRQQKHQHTAGQHCAWMIIAHLSFSSQMKAYKRHCREEKLVTEPQLSEQYRLI